MKAPNPEGIELFSSHGLKPVDQRRRVTNPEGVEHWFRATKLSSAITYQSVGKNTANTALNELVEHGLLKIASHAAFNQKQRFARRWSLTDEPLNDQPATNEWRTWKPTPKIRLTVLS